MDTLDSLPLSCIVNSKFIAIHLHNHCNARRDTFGNNPIFAEFQNKMHETIPNLDNIIKTIEFSILDCVSFPPQYVDNNYFSNESYAHTTEKR